MVKESESRFLRNRNHLSTNHHCPQVMDITQKYRIDMEKGKKTEASTMTDEQLCILYAVCHVTSMLSACANPVIYGYLNENFNREFKDIFSKLGLSRSR